MIYKTSDGAGLPWHRHGRGREAWTIEEATREVLEGTGEVGVESLYRHTGEVASGVAVTVWDGRQIGSVGPNYRPIQNKEFFSSFVGWESEGLGSVETAGLLRGGQIAWLQIRLAGEPICIRKDDHVRPFFFGSNGHDKSVGVNVGYSLTRVVCNNTRRMALREVSQADFGLRFKHTNNVLGKLASTQAIALKIRKDALQEAEALRYLAKVKVQSEEVARRFVLGLQGKKDYMSAGLESRLARVEEDLLARFTGGIGNRGESFWDLVCAVDERLDHDLGNVKTGEAEADRAGRRLHNAWFGQGNLQRQRALDVALCMAESVQPRTTSAVL
jgi:hypothetical protein